MEMSSRWSGRSLLQSFMTLLLSLLNSVTRQHRGSPTGASRAEDRSGASSHGAARSLESLGNRMPNATQPVAVAMQIVEAARAAVDEEISFEPFVLAARAAHFRADPELAARLSDLALLIQFEELRRAGRLPVA